MSRQKSKKTEPSKEMAEVLGIISKWKPILELDKWHIEVELINESDGIGAEIRPNPIYQRAQLRVYPGAFNDTFSLEYIIVHEMCHCIVSGYNYLFDNYVFKDKHISVDQEHEQNELITNIITRIVTKAYGTN